MEFKIGNIAIATNDKYEHLSDERMGHATLEELICCIKRKLRFMLENKHFMARFDHNEIVLFLDDIASKEVLQELGQYILAILNNPIFYIASAEQYAIYRSGAAIAYINSGNFEKLYRSANLATQKADFLKLNIYSDPGKSHRTEICDLIVSPDAANDNLLKLSNKDSAAASVIMQALNLLLGTTDTTTRVQQVLELLSVYYGSERTIIWEMDEQETSISNTFEYCCGIEHTVNSKSIPLSDLPTFAKAQRERTGFIIEDISKFNTNDTEDRLLYERGINSLYAAPLMINDQVIGFLVMHNPALHLRDTNVLNALAYCIINEIFKHRTWQHERYIFRADILTGVLSRNSFVEDLRLIKPETLSSLGIAMVDVNELKEINRKFGNEFGDDVLLSVSQTILKYFDKKYIYRYSGSCFLIMHPDVAYDRFRKQAAQIQIDCNKSMHYDAVVGYTWSDLPEDLGKMIAEADELVISAKRELKSKQLNKKTLQTDAVYKEIMKAINAGYCHIYLQPKATSADCHICGAEALIRINSPNYRAFTPSMFIPILEDLGLVRYIDFFVLEEVFKTLQRWKQEGRHLYPISLNFSRCTIMEPDIVGSILDIADQYDVDRKLIEIELTERMGDLERDTIERIGKAVLKAGFSLSLDDFGSKYSNLTILASVPFATLKIDKKLIDRIAYNKMSLSIIKNIISLCRESGISVVAEGVETEDQLEQLRAVGCEYIQGYLLNKPIPVEDFEQQYNSAQS